MKKIVLFDTSQGTSNIGDYIIMESVLKHLHFITEGNLLLRYPTHTPLLHLFQLFRETVISRNCRESSVKFIGGTNILKVNFRGLTPDWNINIFTKKLYRGSVTVGCGVSAVPTKINRYTRCIYETTLSKDYIHSTRDEASRIFLENLGYEALNTGCPTTWSLTKEHCKTIPCEKSSQVVFTLTDYAKDREKDQKLIDILNSNYNQVYYWVQGSEDFEYISSLNNTEKIIKINPNLDAYRKLLRQGNIDYVGTRLHAGIFAMQHSIRSIIIIVDNRARDMQQSYNINAIERENIADLEKKIQSVFATIINIDVNAIKKWKEQFIRGIK